MNQKRIVGVVSGIGAAIVLTACAVNSTGTATGANGGVFTFQQIKPPEIQLPDIQQEGRQGDAPLILPIQSGTKAQSSVATTEKAVSPATTTMKAYSGCPGHAAMYGYAP